MKILFHKPTNTFKTYPRNDDEPVIGLSSDFDVYDVVSEERPFYDSSTEFIKSKEIIDHINKKLINSWETKDLPTYNPETQKLFYDTNLREYIVIEKSNQDNLREKIEEGFTVNPENITLAISESDRSAFSQMLTLVQEAISLGMITNDTPQTIADKSGTLHTVSTLRFRQIMVMYGMYYKQLWDQYKY